MAIQLPLGIGLRDDASFDNFLTTGNEQVVATLREQDTQNPIIYVWGSTSSGKTHLLQAWCRAQLAQGCSVAYLPLAQYAELLPEMCEGLEQLDAVCIDDVDAIAGMTRWEEALFHLYNRMRDAGKRLLFAAKAKPNHTGLHLADLVSRLNAALMLGVAPLDDEAKRQVLQLRSLARGMEMSDEAAQFILRHYPRDLSNLLAMLDTLDHASLAAQRRLTIPFIKQVMQW